MASDGKTWNGSISLDPYNRIGEVESYMRHVMEYVPCGTLARTVAGIIERLGGHTIVDGKPVYWLNAVHLERFRGIAKSIEDCSAETDKHGEPQDPTRIDILTVLANADMVRSVTAMVTAMIKSEVATVKAEIDSGELKEKACDNRIAKCGRLAELVSEYEAVLETPFTAIKQAVSEAAILSAQASLAAAACQYQ
jgi:hypothetical protein